MFRGRYEHTVTNTGRVSIPSRFREVCRDKYGEETFVITNFDKCLVAYPLKEWNEIENKISELPQFRQDVTAFMRYLMGGAVDCPIDSQGRVLIPQTLRSHANINKEVVMIGMLKKIEIWAKETWDEQESISSYEQFKKSREILAEHGL
ncbi:MAG: division/cell wall cluster transcriptional repressor MraZ [Thermodesulfobacteriota bacterium]